MNDDACRGGASFGSGPQCRGPGRGCLDRRPGRPQVYQSNGDDMSVVVYIVLTVAIFALLGLVQKLVEGL